MGAMSLVIGLSVYASLLGRVAREGGKVRTSEFAVADLLVSIVLAGVFAALVWASVRPHAHRAHASVSADQILPNAAFFLVLFVGLAAFLRSRGIRLTRVLGLDRLAWPRALATAIALIIAAFPLVIAAGALMQNLLHGAATEQELVTLFRDVTRKADYQSIVKIFAAGVIIAPLSEEFLFRGYLYGVFKRYFGAPASATFTAALFAIFHMNLASLPSLFVLAICFTIAYETTGTLLVPMSMHALFNSTQLLFLYRQVVSAAS
jgi:membrane protease YdiL (CAAX protease family)